MTTRKQYFLASSCLLMLATAHARKPQQHPTDALLTASSVAPFQTHALATSNFDSGLLSSRVEAAESHRTIKAPQVPINAAAASFVNAYIKKNGEVLQKVAQRSDAVFRIMEPILLKYDLPIELKYLAVVESDLKRTAVSRVGAAGPWQLMPATARSLGLHVSRKYDERKQYAKSTTAAAKYLRNLYRTYGDWLLVIAAYNAGPGVVNKAIRLTGSRNFWKLQYRLPAETRGHVKRFIGTHYFFEEQGGETTLTKAEAAAYARALAEYSETLPRNEEALTPLAVLMPNAETVLLQIPTGTATNEK